MRRCRRQNMDLFEPEEILPEQDKSVTFSKYVKRTIQVVKLKKRNFVALIFLILTGIRFSFIKHFLVVKYVRLVQ